MTDFESSSKTIMMTLPSDVETDGRYEDNIPSKFTVPLCSSFDVNSGERWEVALSEVTIPNTIHNVTGEMATIKTMRNKIVVVEDSDENVEEKTVSTFGEIKLPSAAYNVRDFLDILNMELSLYNFTSRFGYFEEINRITYKKAKKEHFVFHPDLAEALGLDTDHYVYKNVQMLYDQQMTFSNRPRLDAFVEHIFIYVGIIQYSRVGDTLAPLIRTVLIDRDRLQTGMNASIHFEPRELVYHRVAKPHFKEISVMLCDSYGTLVKFNGGKTVLTLKFVRVS